MYKGYEIGSSRKGDKKGEQMTKINKLEMMGFKSFSKKTTMLFPTNFVVICGPNGSGKSNVLDAVCFVLGRSRAKSMRASKMKEMIFNGGTKAKPADMAKVSLFIDNKDGTFPFDEDQIIVSRSVNRNGISNYRLNGRTVTREKILEVIRRAHIHPDGHNIILQGDITEVIELNPAGRREIIDEISGVQEFEEKRIKSQSELNKVEERLSRSQIILNEKENQLKKLEDEKKSAQEHEKLSKELDKLRGTMATKRLDEAKEAMKKLNENIFEKEENTDEFDKEYEKIESELEKKEKDLKGMEEKLIDRSKDIALIKESEKIRSKIKTNDSKIESNKNEISRLDDLVVKLQNLKERQIEGDFKKSVKKILTLEKDGVLGTISKLSKVPVKYQTAIKVSAGSHLQDIVVDNSKTAVECVNYLKRNKIGRATFLPLDKIQERKNEHLRKYLKEDGVIGLAINLVEFDKRHWHAFSFVFGSTLIVDKVETAKRIGFKTARFVTLDGDLIERSGAVIGGFYFKDKRVLFDTSEIERYGKIKDKLEKEIEELDSETSILSTRLEDLLEEEKKGGSELGELRKDRKKFEDDILKLRKRRKTLYNHKISSKERSNKLKIQRARLEAELENIEKEFEDYKNVDAYDDLDINIVQERINKTFREIQKLGAINQRALDEYKQVKIIYDDLKEKVDTLTRERERVLNLIVEIEGRRKASFMETMNAVSIHFEKIFHDLTDGYGKLRLEGYNPDNPDETPLEECGLVIEAAIGTTRVLGIDSLSGGEKTLTALAFLFAIQQFRPAPFYILDEIDAALDRRNTKKITDLITNYSNKAQFIVITHNDVTMKAADTVYGCSMTGGESKIVGIRMP